MLLRVLVAACSLEAIMSIDIPDARQKASELVKQMRLEEKLLMMGGITSTYTGNVPAIERLGIPKLSLQDGPQGFRTNADKTGPLGSTTAWPSVLSFAASWDESLGSKWGTAMGKEFKGKVRAN